MATLFNTKISATYEGLLKTIDNAAITATLRELTDGSGNQSGLYLNTAGDFKVTAILEWGSLKDTGTGVTITQFVTAANGIENFDNDTTIPTSAAVKIYVDSKPGESLTQVLGFGNTTSGTDILVSAGDNITFTDTSKILMGAGSDLQIYHDGSNSYVSDTGVGSLILSGTDLQLKSAGNEFYMYGAADGQVSLYHNGIKKFETTTSGANVTGNLTVTGTITASGGSFLPLAGGTMTGNIVLNDNVKSIYGTANDGLEIYHDGSNSYIDDTGTGDLTIRASNDLRLQAASTEAYLTCNENGSVEVYYNNNLKFQTASSGVSVTGALSTTTNVTVGANATFVDNGKAIFGAGGDLEIFHDGSNSYINDAGTGNLNILGESNIFIGASTGGANMAQFIKGGAVKLRYNDSNKFETTNTGVTVTGDLEVTGTITGAGGSFLPLIGGTMTGDTIHNDNVKAKFGASGDLEIYHNGSHSYISDVNTGSLYLQTNGSAIYLQDTDSKPMAQFSKGGGSFLMYNGNLKLATLGTGIAVTGNGAFTGSVSVPDSAFLYAGSSDDFSLTHNGTDSIIRNYTGDFQINQGAVTKSIVFKVSDANALDVTALTINRSGDLITGRDVTIAGDLTVNGTTTTVNSQTLSVDDPLISLAINNTANSLDIGYYGKYNDGTTRYLGLFNDASDSNKFKLFKGTTVEPTTTVNIGGAGYVAADLVVAGLEAEENIEIRSGNKLILQRPNNGVATEISTDSTGAMILNSINDEGFFFNNNGTNAFKLDPINATFAGDVTISKSTPKLTFDNLSGGGLDPSLTASGTDFTLSTASITPLSIALDTGNATFAGDVSLADDKRLKIGTGGDIQIFHDTASSFIDAYNQNLVIRSMTADKDIEFQADNGSGGVGTYMKLWGAISSLAVYKDMLFVNDGANGKLKFGASQDLQIYHDGSNSYIKDTSGTGDLIIDTNTFRLRSANGGETMIRAFEDGAVILSHNNFDKLATTNTGVSVTGNIVVNTTSNGNNVDNIVAEFGNDLGTTQSRDAWIKSLSSSGDTDKSWAFGSTQAGEFKFNYLGTRDTAPTSGTTVLTIGSTGNATFAGNVGIGTTSPSEKLEVDGNIRVSSGTQGIYSSFVQAISSTGLKIGNDDFSGYAYFHNDGNVGIGTTSPTAPLQVVGMAEHTDNAAAITAGLTVGAFYRTGDLLKVVH